MERITNKQFAQQIEEYLEQGNVKGDFEQVAMGLTSMPYPLCDEAWKLVKQIVKHIAKMSDDECREEAAKVYEYMRDMHMM